MKGSLLFGKIGKLRLFSSPFKSDRDQYNESIVRKEMYAYKISCGDIDVSEHVPLKSPRKYVKNLRIFSDHDNSPSPQDF